MGTRADALSGHKGITSTKVEGGRERGDKTAPLGNSGVYRFRDFPSLPMGKIDRAREFLATTDYEAGVTRVSLKRLQELPGNLEQWSLRNASLACETPHIDRLLRFKEGLPSPKGSVRLAKQAYIDFWDSLEYIRVQMSTGVYGAQSYTGGIRTSDRAW